MNNRPDDFGLNSRGENRQFQLRDARPAVAEHCARLIFRHQMDYESAASAMLKARNEEASDADITSLARKMEKSKHIQREIGLLYENMEMDDAAFKSFVGKLRRSFDDQTDKMRPVAARLLKDLFVEMKLNKKPEKVPSLRISGAEELMQNMLGDAAPTNDIDPDVPPLPDLDTMEDDGELDGQTEASD